MVNGAATSELAARILEKCKELNALKSAVDSVIEQGLDISETANSDKAVYDFNERKTIFLIH